MCSVVSLLEVLSVLTASFLLGASLGYLIRQIKTKVQLRYNPVAA